MAVDLRDAFLPLPSLLFIHGWIIFAKAVSVKGSILNLFSELFLFFYLDSSGVACHFNDMKFSYNSIFSSVFTVCCNLFIYVF